MTRFHSLRIVRYLSTDAEFTIDDKPVDPSLVQFKGHSNMKVRAADIIQYADSCVQIDWTEQLYGMHTLGIRAKDNTKVLMLATVAWF
jgi:hypothetical protein